MSEIWRAIPNHEGYEVSNLGRVRNVKTLKIKKVGTTGENRLYKNITFYTGHNKWKSYALHRLVAEVFIPNPNNYKYINHKNEDPADNRVENLEWCTQSYNINYGSRNLKVGAKLRKRNKAI